MTAGENLYVNSDGWVSGVYVPAYARRYPFCMAKVKLNDVEQQNRMICVEKAHLDESGGETMFDNQGEPSEKWRGMQRLLAEYEADLERARELCAILADYALLEPFSMQAKTAQGVRCSSPACTASTKRRSSPSTSASSKNLAKKGILGRIYAHLLSLENFSRLLERKATR